MGPEDQYPPVERDIPHTAGFVTLLTDEATRLTDEATSSNVANDKVPWGMMKQSIVIVPVIVAFVVAWQLCVSSGAISSLVVASPSQIISAIVSSGSGIWSQLGATVEACLIAVVIAVSVGVLSGSLVGANLSLYRAIGPIFNGAFAVPWVLTFPMFVVWFGLGLTTQIAFGAVLAVMPVASVTATAVHSISDRYRPLARSLAVSRVTGVRKILIPGAFPSVLGATRIGVALAVIGVLTAEILGSDSGLGYFISFNRQLLNTGSVYGGIIIALVMAWVAMGAVSVVLRRWAR